MSIELINLKLKKIKCAATGEARTHDLQIMRLTRCLLRYGGTIHDASMQNDATNFF